ncbi:transcriptional regulator [Azorhizobium oxalatiphilum]|uniref:Transcriptional regulator n=1 Tax=Azorhizobium oxalatiphilum TaxID=980631 RepID=A0A917BYE3_9HYPH|nr:XRE family transcriptional regulator [Azorhizobium oxalatiphilum]GGF61783.1 transcriptional regulator [Azorhizobium oxalatiphilum]
MLDASKADRLGPNLRQLRTEKGLTLDRLATASALTRGYLSLVERGLKTPSITALLRLAEALGVNIAQLFDLNAKPSAQYTLTRNGEAMQGPDGGFGLFPLAAGRTRKMMEPFLMTPDMKPAVRSDPRWAHGGEELLFVVSGRIAIQLGAEELEMSAGDCLYFEGEIKHEVRSVGPVRAQVLVVIALPQDAPDAGTPAS